MAAYRRKRSPERSHHLVKELNDREMRFSVLHANNLAELAQKDAQNMKKRALFRHAGLKTPEMDLGGTTMSNHYKEHSTRTQSRFNTQTSSNPFSSESEFTFGRASVGTKRPWNPDRERTSMDGLMTGRYSKERFNRTTGSEENFDKYNTLLAGAKEHDHFESVDDINLITSPSPSLVRSNPANYISNTKRAKYRPTVNLKMSASTYPNPPKELFKMKKFAKVRSRTDHSWT